MKRSHFLLASAVLALVSAAPIAAADETGVPPRLYAIGSWGDLLHVYGPGTDPSMDTPQAMENMIKQWKGRGYAGVYMRTDLGQIDALIRRNPITATTQASQGTGNSDPRLSWLYKYIDRVQTDFDFQELGAKLSAKNDFEWWAWHPHIYSDGAPETAGGPGKGRIWPWTYVTQYKIDHPEIVTVDRKGNKLWMVREYAYPGARQSMVDEFVHMAKTFGIKRFIACMRSEVSQIQDPPDKADRYGFNQPVVDDMKRLYGVDIMTDPRFDVDSDTFDLNDPMVNKWRDLKGTYVTQLYRDLRKSLRDVDPSIQFAVTLSGDHVGPPMGNWRLDWKTWVDEGIVDAIISPVFFEATLDNDAARKGYLTHSRENIGTVDHAVMRDYIAKSKHPEIKVIATMGPPYRFESPPAGADGWRIDMWYSAYNLAWYQRWWKQCFADVRDNGHIAFIKQNFDDFPIGSAGFAGGWGDYRYNPQFHACPGVWYQLGDGTGPKPAATKEQARGGSGAAIRLHATDDSSSSLIALHNSFPDRTGIYNGVDNAITNGVTRFEFWVYRASQDSGITAYLQDTGKEHDVGLNVEPGSGNISYSVGRGDATEWKRVDFTVPIGQWQRLMIDVDLDARVYHGYAGDEKTPTTLWRDVPVEAPAQRYYEHPNINIPVPVPTYKMFKQVVFIPQGKAGSTSFVDDVSVNWTPTLHYIKPRPKVFFAEDFERHAADLPINNARTHRGGMWTTTSEAGTKAFTVTNDTSFGEGVHSLIATAGGTAVAKGDALRHIPNSYITVDLDLFVRSDKDYPYVMPDPTTTSNHWSMVGLRRKGTDDAAAVALAARGTWWLWDGTRYVDSGVRVAYDVWNHLQIAVDAPTGAYQLVTQPIGEMPTLVGHAKLGESIVINSDLEFFIQTSDTQNHLSYYDNISVTAGARP